MDINKLINQSIQEVLSEAEDVKGLESGGLGSEGESVKDAGSPSPKPTTRKGYGAFAEDPEEESKYITSEDKPAEKYYDDYTGEEIPTKSPSHVDEHDIFSQHPGGHEAPKSWLSKLFGKTKEGLKKGVEYVKEHPGKTALATGAAIAAGLGALALAKKLRQSKKEAPRRPIPRPVPAAKSTQR